MLLGNMSQESPIILDDNDENDEDSGPVEIKIVETRHGSTVDKSERIVTLTPDRAIKRKVQPQAIQSLNDDSVMILDSPFNVAEKLNVNPDRATSPHSEAGETVSPSSSESWHSCEPKEVDENLQASQESEGTRDDANQNSDSVLDFSWRSAIGLASISKSKKRPLTTPITAPAPVENAISPQQTEAELAAIPLKKKKSAKPKKGAKSEQEKLEIAVALGKHRHLEVHAIASPEFFAGGVGPSFEYMMHEHQRGDNLVNDDTVPPNLLYFRRHLLELNQAGQVAAVKDQYFVERIFILVWRGIDLVSDLQNTQTKNLWIRRVEGARKFISKVRENSLECDPPKLLVILEDCDAAIAKTRLPMNVLEDFLTMDLEIRLNSSFTHCKTAMEVAELCFANFLSVEKWPYRKIERGADFLDNVKRFKSFSAFEELMPGEHRTNRAIDGIQLQGIWTNQLRCLPRVSGPIAEGIVQQYPSFRALCKALEEDPDNAEYLISNARKEVRREKKLAKTVRAFFMSDIADQKLV